MRAMSHIFIMDCESISVGIISIKKSGAGISSKLLISRVLQVNGSILLCTFYCVSSGKSSNLYSSVILWLSLILHSLCSSLFLKAYWGLLSISLRWPAPIAIEPKLLLLGLKTSAKSAVYYYWWSLWFPIWWFGPIRWTWTWATCPYGPP